MREKTRQRILREVKAVCTIRRQKQFFPVEGTICREIEKVGEFSHGSSVGLRHTSWYKIGGHLLGVSNFNEASIEPLVQIEADRESLRLFLAEQDRLWKIEQDHGLEARRRAESAN